MNQRVSPWGERRYTLYNKILNKNEKEEKRRKRKEKKKGEKEIKERSKVLICTRSTGQREKGSRRLGISKSGPVEETSLTVGKKLDCGRNE